MPESQGKDFPKYSTLWYEPGAFCLIKYVSHMHPGHQRKATFFEVMPLTFPLCV